MSNMSNILILDSKGETHNISALTEKLETLQRENETLKLRICLLDQSIALRKKSAEEKKLEHDKLLVDFEKLSAVMKDRERMIDGMIHTISTDEKKQKYDKLLVDFEKLNSVMKDRDRMIDGMIHTILNLRRENMFERSDTERSDTVGRVENPLLEGQSPP